MEQYKLLVEASDVLTAIRLALAKRHITDNNDEKTYILLKEFSNAN